MPVEAIEQSQLPEGAIGVIMEGLVRLGADILSDVLNVQSRMAVWELQGIVGDQGLRFTVFAAEDDTLTVRVACGERQIDIGLEALTSDRLYYNGSEVWMKAACDTLGPDHSVGINRENHRPFVRATES